MWGIGKSAQRRGRGLAVITGAAGLLLAACTSGGHPAASASHRPAGHSPAARAASAPVITPADGSRNVSTSAAITVTSAGGPIRSVQVTAGHHQVPVSGQLSTAPGGKRATWHSTWALHAGQRYTVTATSGGPGGSKTVSSTSSFRTFTPADTFTTEIYEGYQQTFGVGMPIILYFSQPITRRAAVERALQVTSSKPVYGAWYWDGDKTLYFRPQSYWPAHTTVSFDGHLDGVEGARGMYATADLTQTFRIGGSLIVTASTANHYMHVYRDGHLLYTWPISTGRPGDNTPNGTYLTIDKANPVLMTGPGYSLEVPWSVRITWSGDYLHDAYWSVGEQGFTNVSHGCVNMPPADAQTYYQMENPGDPVMITGSPVGGTWDNGWTVWFLSFKKLVRGSALGEAVQAGPDGSRFVNLSAVPPSTASYPLQTATPGSAAAS
ncbi:MAG: Ig-like domain-containing protein [Streptosporangiaceae bacterium]